jgi:hypothetical protein
MSVSPFFHRFRAVLQILLLQSLLPLTLTYIFVEWARRKFPKENDLCQDDGLEDQAQYVSDDSDSSEDSLKKEYRVVLTGGKMSKTLHLCRCLRSFADANNSQVDLEIIVLENKKFRYNATRMSKCVDIFCAITSPRECPQMYKNELVEACRKHNATHFLPVAAPVEAVYDAQIKDILEGNGTVFLHMDYNLCSILDDKHKFCSFLREELKITGLRTHQVSSDDDARAHNHLLQDEMNSGNLKRTMILKNLAYDPIHRLDLFQLPCHEDVLNLYLNKVRQDGNAITEEEPWQLQEFLRDGIEYAAMIVVRQNKLVALTCAASSASQLNYVHVEVPAVREWVESFMSSLQKQDGQYELTGQLCFDFMVVQENNKSMAYPIECNPRVHTQCTVYNSDRTRALFGKILLESSKDVKEQLDTQMQDEYDDTNKIAKESFWFYNEFFKMFPNNWLIKYNDDKDHVRRSKMLLQDSPKIDLRRGFFILLYLPALLLCIVLATPVLLCISFISVCNASATTGEDGTMTLAEHLKAMQLKGSEFFTRLIDSEHNVEVDMWTKDPIPFLVKNHVQVVVRLLASLRTGVEWKKIDFAIGKVVEVGGD